MDLLGFIIQYKYPALLLATIVEGPIAMTAGGFLLRLGQLELVPTFLVLVIGDLVADIAWYGLGYYGAGRLVAKFGKYVNITDQTVEKIKTLFQKHEENILFFSKLSMGFGFALAVLITAGMIRVSFRKFVWLNFLGELIWTSFMLMLGYFLGNIYVLIDQGLHAGFVFVSILAILAALIGFSHYLRGRFLKNNNGAK